MTRRIDRINVLLRQEISRILAAELRDPRMASMVSVTRVEASPDLSRAKVFVSVYGDGSEKANTLKALKSGAGFIRRNMRHNLTFKTLPYLEFHLDDSIERGSEILELIREVAPGPETVEQSEHAS